MKEDTDDLFPPVGPEPLPHRLRIGITERGDGGLEIDTVLKKLPKFDGAIIITKAPHLLLKYGLPPNTIIHATITGMGRTSMEPGVLGFGETAPAYWELVQKYGGERVVLRVDPVLPEDEWIPQLTGMLRNMLPGNSKQLGRSGQAKGCRVRVSFLDFYPHVQERLRALPYGGYIPKTGIHASLVMREYGYKMINREVEKLTGQSVEVCGEPDLPCTGCVSERDLRAMGLTVPAEVGLKGQRPACQCLAAKVEMLDHKGQCPHKCVYCYWK